MPQPTVDPHTNRIDGVHQAPPHYHRAEPREVCTMQHHVEPLAYPQGGFFEDLVSYHEHGNQDISGALVTQVLDRMGLDCGRVGVHTHPMGYHKGQGVYGTLRTPHHHHDIRCLVEAGANPVRLDLLHERESHTRTRGALESVRDSLAEKVERLGVAQRRLEDAREERSLMEEFMTSMPAVGPWATLTEQYGAWLLERAEVEEEVVGDTHLPLDDPLLAPMQVLSSIQDIAAGVRDVRFHHLLDERPSRVEVQGIDPGRRSGLHLSWDQESITLILFPTEFPDGAPEGTKVVAFYQRPAPRGTDG